MAELIDKWKVVDMLTALENEFQHYKPFQGFEHAMYRKVVAVEMEIGEMTAVEAEPVVHAHWEFIDFVSPNSKCSVCGGLAPMDCCGDYHSERTERCPHCGAHMDEEVSDGD